MTRYTSDIKEDRAYSQPEDCYKYYQTNPPHSRETSATLADVTDGTDDDYLYYINMSGYRYAGLQFATFDGGSGTISGSVAVSCEPGADASSVTYTEASVQYLGGDYITGPGFHVIDTPLPVKYLRVKVSAESGDDSCDWTIHSVLKW